MKILYHEDDTQVEFGSSVEQFNDYFAASVGGVNVPIEFDQIDYIDCGKVVSHPVIVDIDSPVGYLYPNGHLVEAKKKIIGDDSNKMEIAMSDDKVSVRAHSSLNQFSTFFTGRIGHNVLPIEFDQIDYIDCGRVVSHPVIVDNGDNIGYIFSDGIAEYTTDTYPLFEHKEVVTRDLPAEFGEGKYEAYEDYNVIVNYDDESFGTREITSVRYGQDYFLADEILPAEDFE